MIDKISIKNYKSIQSLQDFELKGVNVLIGANNSGKSNFLDVFAFLRDTLQEDSFVDAQGHKLSGWRGALERRGGGESVCFSNAQQFELKCLIHPIRYSLEIGLGQGFLGQYYQILNEEITDENSEKMFVDRENGSIVFYDKNGQKYLTSSETTDRTNLSELLRQSRVAPEALNFATRLSEIKIYDRLRTEKWAPMRSPQKPKGETILDEDGNNLIGVLYQLSQIHPRFLSDLNAILKILFPDFLRISFPSNEKGEILLRWEDTTGRVMNASQLSDGTLKFLCMMAILKNPKPPALIGMDEIDVKLHPMMQGILADIIREASKDRQIIATTHNPDFVSQFDPQEIMILQQYHGATEIRRLSNKGALDLWLQDFTIRKLWLMGELESRW